MEGENNGQPRRRTIRDVTRSDVTNDPFNVACPNLEVNFELKGPLLNSLPRFHGLEKEDPCSHLNALHVACSNMKPVGARLDDVKLKVFYFTLEGKAQEWYMMLPRHVNDALHSWANMKKAFLEKYLPDARIGELKKEIYSIKQDPLESFYEYWCRFQELLAKCPHHQIVDEQLIKYFHDGLLPNEKGIIDAAAGGSLEDCTAAEGWAQIRTRARNTQQYNAREIRGVCDIGSNQRMVSLESKMDTVFLRIP
ncbi:hypothetical protein QN277_008769 [Acacia crassicarpa]|uniref:Retrotransposon gag domain-containing protein n=1 Tax=Acacia crassicarpa TaxID=499986 RepID=A0AAE1IU00_9FABA|nr:hypothetical protein QN277_008769 [Acacia crassicarpa]